MFTGYLSLGAGLTVTGPDRTDTSHWAERFTVCFCNSKWQQQQHCYCHLLFIAFLERSFIGNTVLLLCANCTVTVMLL
jgi:hypothetical protein